MRWTTFTNPALLFDRFATAFRKRQRLQTLRGTVATNLKHGHLNCLELFQLLRATPPQVIYDIGANVGTSTLLLRTVLPEAEIHAFEPLFKHCDEFQKNVQHLRRVMLHQIALGAENGSETMKVARLSDASSLLAPAAEYASDEELPSGGSQVVTIKTLDDYVGSHAIPLPDLLKIDVQGYELKVLQGAQTCLKHARAIITEVSFVPIYQTQALFHDLIGFCASEGFLISAVAENTVRGQRLMQADVLFERERPSDVGK